jgi:hypothetical protein
MRILAAGVGRAVPNLRRSASRRPGKKSGSPRPEWAGHFPAVTRMGLKIGDGAVICLCREMLPIRRGVTATPLGML